MQSINLTKHDSSNAHYLKRNEIFDLKSKVEDFRRRNNYTLTSPQ